LELRLDGTVASANGDLPLVIFCSLVRDRRPTASTHSYWIRGARWDICFKTSNCYRYHYKSEKQTSHESFLDQK